MKKVILIAALTRSLIITLTVMIIMLSNPLMRSEKRIRDYILNITPIGVSMDEVMLIIEEKEKWEVRAINHERGYTNSRTYIPNTDPDCPLEFTNPVIGEKSIRVYLGRSWIFGHTVTVSWGFDSSGKLIDIYVSKVLAI